MFLITVLALTIATVSTYAVLKQAAGDGRRFDRDTRFYVAKPNPGALQQIADLTAAGDTANADLIRKMIETPQAAWFENGSPESVRQAVQDTVESAAAVDAIPVLVAYNVPGRDCSLYSSGGAATGDHYKAWIDAFAAGVGDHQAVVILEPDGLALTPADCGQPDTFDRLSLINYAAYALQRSANAAVYLDAGHSGWHSVGEMAARLAAGGVQYVQGFFLNASNYRPTEHEVKYATWISKCLAITNDPEEGDQNFGQYANCASQYDPADPNDFSTWHLTDEWYAANLGSALPTTHFVIDTSRNGQGPWSAPSSHPPGDPQEWCDPPDRGLGYRPTADTDQALLDAFLWLKIPGESDGECFRWTEGPLDPARGRQAPPAGEWFADMALELAHNANPPLD